MTTIGDIIEDVNPFTEKGAKIVTVPVIPRKIAEDIIAKCKEDKDNCCDVSGTEAAKDDAIIFEYASEIIDLIESLLSDFENGAKKV